MAKVLKVTAVKRDLENLPQGLNTFVQECGLSLSSSLRVRVALARALYADSDIYLLDDPFSSMDPQIAATVFEKAIRGFLKNKCVLLVTYREEFLKQCRKVYILKDRRLGLLTEDQIESGKPLRALELPKRFLHGKMQRNDVPEAQEAL